MRATSLAPAASLVLALTLPLALAACGNTSLLAPSGLSKDVSAATAADAPAGGAYPSTGAEAKAAPFNPFADRDAVAIGGREVIANPTKDEVMQVGPLPDMAWGSETAPVTIVQYASLTCPYCKKFHAEVFPELKREYIDTGKVRYILREFPIGHTSGNATIALRCAPADKYLDLYGRFLAQQGSWVSQEVRIEKIAAVAAQVGVKADQLDACLKDEALINNLKWVKERGRKLGVIGTPNFFVDGKLYKKVLTIGDIRAMVDPVVAAQPGGAQTGSAQSVGAAPGKS